MTGGSKFGWQRQDLRDLELPFNPDLDLNRFILLETRTPTWRVLKGHKENFSLIPVITGISVVIIGYFFNQPVNPVYLFRMCVLYKPLVFDELNQYYSTCQSLLLLCLGWDKVEFRTHKSLSYYNLPGWTTTRIV